MRWVLLWTSFLLVGCSRNDGVQICTGDYWWNCRYFKNADDALAYTKESAKIEKEVLLSAAKKLDIDYQKCAVVVLSSAIGTTDPAANVRNFVTIFGDDPSFDVITSLADKGISIEPGSQQSHPTYVDEDGIVTDSSSDWRYSFVLRSRLFGGYTARVAASCGALCGGVNEFQLTKRADSCAIMSVKTLRSW